MYYRVLQKLVEVIFPHDCLGCGREGGLLCSLCEQEVQLTEHTSCYACHAPTAFGNLCQRCAPLGALDGVYIMAPYEHKIVQTLIRLYKYEFVIEAGDILARLLNAYLCRIHMKEILRIESGYAIPVPLSKRRLGEREFNQSDKLAKHSSQALGLQFHNNLLLRTRHTEQQAQLAMHDRFMNMRNAFTVTDPHIIAGHDIVLCDDVITTGATLESCAMELKSAGAHRIYAIVLAHHGT